MANFDRGMDLLSNIARRVGEILPTETDVTNIDHLIDLKLYLNNSYWDLCALKPWRWVRTYTQFRSVAQVTGSVTSISGANVTLSAPIGELLGPDTMQGRKFMINSEGLPHRILSHLSGTNGLTLLTSYTGTQTSGAFTIFQDEIDTGLTDILAFPEIYQISNVYKPLIVIPSGEIMQRAPLNVFGASKSRYAAFITDSKIRLSPWTETAVLYEIQYNKRPAALDFSGNVATDTPILPQDDRIAIIQRALVRIYADKRDARLEQAQKELDESLAKMSSKESTFSKPRLYLPSNMRVS